MLEEFKKFAMRGTVVDLAVGQGKSSPPGRFLERHEQHQYGDQRRDHGDPKHQAEIVAARSHKNNCG